MSEPIPVEAVEAAAEAIMNATFGQELPEAPGDLARVALEAALPYIEAQTLEDAAGGLERSDPKGNLWAASYLAGRVDGLVMRARRR